jgi:hypothetical protein
MPVIQGRIGENRSVFRAIRKMLEKPRTSGHLHRNLELPVSDSI